MRILMSLLIAAVLLSCGRGSASIGTTYNDPEGAYTIQVDPAWEIQVGAVAQGVEVWFLGPAEGDLRHVAVNRRAVPANPAPDVTLDAMAAISVVASARIPC